MAHTNQFCQDLREAYGFDAEGALPIDKEAGVIKNVKVLGLQSPNSHGVRGASSTVYTRQALTEAAPLYEGASVNLDHVRRDGEDIPAEKKIGILRNVRVTEDGLRADLHYQKSHPFANRLLEDVERKLGMYSLSHDANGQGPVTNGVFTIKRINRVNSVDLVNRGATNRNLWESDRSKSMSTPERITFRRLIENYWLRPDVSKPRKAWAARLLEEEYMAGKCKEADGMDPMPEDVGAVAAPPSSGTPEEALKEGFRAALMAVVNEALDGGGDAGSALKKVKELLTTHGKLNGGSEPEAPAKESEGEEKPEDKEAKAKESLALAELNARKETDALITSMNAAGFVSAALKEALILLPNNEQRRSLINEQVRLRNTPRSPAVHQPPPVQDPTQAATLRESQYAERFGRVFGRKPTSVESN